MVIDEEGVVFEIGAAVSTWNLPVLAGVKFRDLTAGARLPEQLRPLLGELKALQDSEPGLYALISEVRVVSRTANRYELLMYPVHEPVRIRLGEALEPGAIRNALMVIDVFQRQGIVDRIQELDLRTGEVVYTMKED